jgi:hypothetical protein
MATTALQEGGHLAAAAGTNIAVTENVRYWHAVAGAMSHNEQMLQSADAGSNPGWCILTTVATKLAASSLQQRWMVYNMITCARLSEHQLVTSDDGCNAVQDAALVEAASRGVPFHGFKPWCKKFH